MSESMSQLTTPEVAQRRKDLAPQLHDAFDRFSHAVFSDGALGHKTKQLTAVAAAHVTQCPYCIDGQSTVFKRAGTDDTEIMEAIWAGAYAHSTLALHAIGAHTYAGVE